MDFTGFFHETKSRYAYPVDAHRLHIRLRTGWDAEKVTLVVFDPCNWVPTKEDPSVYELDPTGLKYIPMELEYKTDGAAGRFCRWFAEAYLPTKRAKYAFIAENGQGKYWYGYECVKPFTEDCKVSEMSHLCFIYPYILEEDIFRAPDWVKDTVWYQIFPNSYTGDLDGVTERMADIRGYGFTGIYFTPLFTSPSPHKYNTQDYFQIDPAFGDHAAFGRMVKEAKKRGVRVMLDLVFNHIGSTHPWWKDVVENGKASRYYDCFFVKEEPVVPGGYETFAFVPSMPKWNTANPLARKYLLDVAAYWARTYEVDGFRLDVANEVSHDFWRVFRKEMRAINPELYILGEVWDDATPWLKGEQFDAVMNYPLSRAIWNFVGGKTDGKEFGEALTECMVMYPKPNQRAMFNLIGSHDTARIITVAGGREERAMQAFTLLLTLAGSPCVYYGDEIGMPGSNENKARDPMIFDEAKQNLTIKKFVKKLIALRDGHKAMKAAEVKILYANEKGFAYTKSGDGETVFILLNGRDEETSVSLGGAFAGVNAKDLITGEKITLTDEVKLAAYGVGVYCM